MPRRSALTAPFGLLAIDLLAALSIALMALSLVVGPVLAQEQSAQPSPAAAVETSTVAPTQGPAAAPSLAAEAPSAPLATPAGSSPAASPAPAPSAAPSLASGAHSTQDPCPDPYAPEPGATRDPDAPPPNLCPAQPAGADPLALLSWAFTPIFQAIFLGLAFFYSITGDIGVAIILLTILIRILLIPIFRAQIVSQRRMQMLQPELRAIQAKYKGDRARISAEQMQLYKDRGVNPASGCLPSLLQLVLLMPMYQVFSQGLTAPDISSMLSPFGITLVNVTCQSTTDLSAPCINPDIPWLAWLPTLVGDGPIIPGYPGGLPANAPEIFVVVILGFGLSLLALASSLLQLVQTRMMMTRSDDPQQRTQQRMFMLLPLFSLLYGAILPAGLFIYWITTTIFSIVQQFLINGYGGLFPLFGWTPRFAVDHTPRFPVRMPEPKPPAAGSGGSTQTQTTQRSTTDSAAGTIRPARRRSSRRGRRR
ncbi:MAG TPA: YidC/Oxa1 family membrane protein insertase [Candidatus Deferrimicrobium sp.]|nr:YidC/Oxa1 family membrane protein insertase [Candidatus Deferrimicrobium sp.]